MTIVAKPLPENVLVVALLNLKKDIKIKPSDLAKIIGRSQKTIERIFEKGTLNPASKEGELALLLIRVYRSLFALNGGNKKAMIHWLKTYNHHVQGIPIEEMKTVMGLSRVVNYLDAIRGKV